MKNYSYIVREFFVEELFFRLKCCITPAIYIVIIIYSSIVPNSRVLAPSFGDGQFSIQPYLCLFMWEHLKNIALVLQCIVCLSSRG